MTIDPSQSQPLETKADTAPESQDGFQNATSDVPASVLHLSPALTVASHRKSAHKSKRRRRKKAVRKSTSKHIKGLKHVSSGSDNVARHHPEAMAAGDYVAAGVAGGDLTSDYTEFETEVTTEAESELSDAER